MVNHRDYISRDATDFLCSKCDHFQASGISSETAEMVGWRLTDGKWVCPICSGNEHLLKELFRGDT